MPYVPVFSMIGYVVASRNAVDWTSNDNLGDHRVVPGEEEGEHAQEVAANSLDAAKVNLIFGSAWQESLSLRKGGASGCARPCATASSRAPFSTSYFCFFFFDTDTHTVLYLLLGPAAAKAQLRGTHRYIPTRNKNEGLTDRKPACLLPPPSHVLGTSTTVVVQN